MKKNLIIVLVSVLLSACGMMKNITTSSASSANSNVSSVPAKLAVGDAVVAKAGSNWFSEGKIRVIDGQKANIAWSQKDSTPNDVDLANVYPLPKPGAQLNVKADDFVLAKTSASSDTTDWTLAQVTAATKDVITVKDRNNNTYNLSPDKIIAVSPTDAADIKGAFDKNNKEQDFEKTAQSKRPVAPDGYKPKVGDMVVGPSYQQYWYAGQIKSITGDKATILYDTAHNNTMEIDLDKVVPSPTAANMTMPAVNDYIAVKSSNCAACAWIFEQVTAVNGTSVETKDQYDTKYTTKPGEFLILK